jgi:hypothetical protein
MAYNETSVMRLLKRTVNMHMLYTAMLFWNRESLSINSFVITINLRRWGSSFSIVPDYRLDDRAIAVRFPAEDISSNLCVKTSSGAHPASCPMDTKGPAPGVKHGSGVMLTTHPIYAEVKNE